MVNDKEHFIHQIILIYSYILNFNQNFLIFSWGLIASFINEDLIKVIYCIIKTSYLVFLKGSSYFNNPFDPNDYKDSCYIQVEFILEAYFQKVYNLEAFNQVAFIQVSYFQKVYILEVYFQKVYIQVVYNQKAYFLMA